MEGLRYKFRAWDSKNKKMYNDGDKFYLDHFNNDLKKVTSSCLITNKGIYYTVHETQLPYATDNYFDHSNIYISNDIKIMQCAGLKDKNGVKIFEHDIIIGPTCSWHKDSVKHIVEWNAKYTGFDPFGLADGSLESDQVKVIGNIYENPELLEDV